MYNIIYTKANHSQLVYNVDGYIYTRIKREAYGKTLYIYAYIYRLIIKSTH